MRRRALFVSQVPVSGLAGIDSAVPGVVPPPDCVLTPLMGDAAVEPPKLAVPPPLPPRLFSALAMSSAMRVFDRNDFRDVFRRHRNVHLINHFQHPLDVFSIVAEHEDSVVINGENGIGQFRKRLDDAAS